MAPFLTDQETWEFIESHDSVSWIIYSDKISPFGYESDALALAVAIEGDFEYTIVRGARRTAVVAINAQFLR